MDFYETWASIETMSTAEVRHVIRNIAAIATSIFVLCVAVAYADDVSAKKAKDSLVGLKESQTVLKTFSRSDTEASDFMSKYCDADTVFPESCRSESFYKLFISEIKRAHRWVSLLFHHEPEYPRHVKLLFLVSVVNSMVFLNTLLFNWLRVDSGRCSQFESVAECLEEPSKYAFFKPMCFWDREMELSGGANSTALNYCLHTVPTSKGDLVLTVAAISGLLSIPIVMFVEIIVVYFLGRPILKSDQVLPSTLLDDRHLSSMKSGNESCGSCLCKFRNRIKVDVEERARLAQDIFEDVRQLLFDLKNYRKQIKSRHVRDFDSRWGFSGDEIDFFLSEIEKVSCLKLSNSGENGNVIVGKVRRAVHVLSRVAEPLTPPFRSRVLRRLWNDILEVRLKADEELDIMEKTLFSKDSKGNRMIMLFKRDLLQGLRSELLSTLFVSRALASTSSIIMKAYHTVHSHLLGYFVLFLTNIFFLVYIFLFTVRQSDDEYRTAWVTRFLIWICLEIIFLSTLNMTMTSVLPAIIAMKDLREVVRLFRSTLMKVVRRNSVADNLAGEVMRQSERGFSVHPLEACEEPFNTTRYFFVSRRLAKMFPDLLESKVIEQFRSVIPNRPYSYHWDGPVYGDRVKFRWAACIESAAVVIVYILLTVLSTIPALEYYLTSIVGWLLLGVLSDAGDIRVFGTRVKFNGLIFLIVVLLFYIIIFIMYRRALKAMKREYKVGRVSLVTKEDIRNRMRDGKLVRGAQRNRNSKKLGFFSGRNSVVPEHASNEDVSSVVDAEQLDEGEEKESESGGEELASSSITSRDQVSDKIEIPLLYLNSSDDDDDDNVDVKLESSRVDRHRRSTMINSGAYSSDEEIDEKSAKYMNNENLDMITGPGMSNCLERKNRPMRMWNSSSDSDLEKAVCAAEFLQLKGISLENGADLSRYRTVAEALKRMDEDSLENSDGNSDSDSLEDISENDILESYRYLSSLGVSLADNVDPLRYVKVAKALRVCEIGSLKNKEDGLRDVEKWNLLAMSSSDSDDLL